MEKEGGTLCGEKSEFFRMLQSRKVCLGHSSNHTAQEQCGQKKKRERKRKRDQALGVIVTVGTWRDSKTRVFFYFAGIFKGFNLLRVTSSANLKMIKRKYKK